MSQQLPPFTTVAENNPVSLICEFTLQAATQLLKTPVEWLRNNKSDKQKRILVSNELVVTNNGSDKIHRSKLYIENVETTDEGIYCCHLRLVPTEASIESKTSPSEFSKRTVLQVISVSTDQTASNSVAVKTISKTLRQSEHQKRSSHSTGVGASAQMRRTSSTLLKFQKATRMADAAERLLRLSSTRNEHK